MKHKYLDQLILDLPGYYAISEKQQENVTKLIGVSKKFLNKAKITNFSDDSVSDNTIILESGHQPNFFPYAGISKKAFLQNLIRKTLVQDGYESVAFFGLADQNISTARILSKNQIPALNKDGFIKIGYKIDNSDKLKSFNKVKKPSSEQWQSEINRIEQHYRDLAKKIRPENSLLNKQWDTVLELLWNGYEIASNASELNSIIFAKICHELLAIDVWFFLYSDMHHEQFFLDESRILLRNVSRFNEIFDLVISEKGLDIPPVAPSHIPFWYECECGAKTDLVLSEVNTAEGICPLCKKEYHLHFGDDFQYLFQYFDKLDFNAVSRNIVMAHGLGDTLFVSGAGGSLHYGQISDQISKDLGFHTPVTLAWRSIDFYLGLSHKTAIHELKKTFSLSTEELLGSSLTKKISDYCDQLSQQIILAENDNDRNKEKLLTGMLSNAKNNALFAKKIFSTTSSLIDILANHDRESIIMVWKKSLKNAEYQHEDRIYLITKDIEYESNQSSDFVSDQIPVIYKNIRSIEVP
jgi:DNA-binding ferritin-like protein